MPLIAQRELRAKYIRLSQVRLDPILVESEIRGNGCNNICYVLNSGQACRDFGWDVHSIEGHQRCCDDEFGQRYG